MLLLCISALAGTTTISGSLKDEQGNPLQGTLTMRLPIPAQDPSTNTSILPINVTYNVVNGSVQSGPPLYDVTTIQPSGLYYIARAYDMAGNLVFYANYVVNGASFNIGAATPTSVTTSNISYLTPVFSNGTNTWTGTNTFNGPTIFNGTVTFNGLLNGALIGQTIIVANAGVTGTTVNTLTKLTGAPSTAVIAAISDTRGAVGITTGGAGTSGSATIQQSGQANCVFDGATVAGDYVQISSTTAGNCHDVGTVPANGTQVVGIVLTSNVSAGTYAIMLYPPSVNVPTLTLQNDTTTGTLLNGLAKQGAVGGASTAIRTAITDTSGAVGIVVGGAGTSGSATVQQSGIALCVFDGATTVNDYVMISATAAGNCHDGGTAPTGQVIGQVLSTNGGAGTYAIDLFGVAPEQRASFYPPQRTTTIQNSSIPSGQGTLTTVFSETVTFPATAGTYRALVNWEAVGSSQNSCFGEVIEGSHVYAMSFGQANGGGGGFGASGSELSSITYAAGATPTFSMQMSCNGAQTITGTPTGGGWSFSPVESSYLSVTPVLSN